MAKTVVVIDDDQDDLELMKLALNDVDSSLRCLSFIYPEEALRMLFSKELVVLPDHIFIDINMPRMTGDKCLKMLRTCREFDHIKITLYSTSMPDTVAEALKLQGANHVFEKPVRLKSYAEILQSIIV